VNTVSAIGFIKSCLDIVNTHESLLLGAKAILAARLALNTLPKGTNIYYQSLRDMYSTSRAVFLRRVNESLRRQPPLLALQSYTIVTGSSPPEVLDHFLQVRLTEAKSALMSSSSNSSGILRIINLIRSTLREVYELFPFTFQRTMNELKSTSLLDQMDLLTNLHRRRANIELWIKNDIRKFHIWTKSDIINDSKVEMKVNLFMNDVEMIIVNNASELLSGIEGLDAMCTLRGKIITLVWEQDEEPNRFEKRICQTLVDKTAERITTLLTTQIKLIRELENEARELIIQFKGKISCGRLTCSGGYKSVRVGI
jgi:hypothetical protein